MACPFCHKIGTLILHGFIFGYKENSSDTKKRGRRVLCNKRRKRKQGCGKSFSLLISSLVPMVDYTCKTIWSFLTFLKMGNSIVTSFFKTGIVRSERAIYRFWRRFRVKQHTIRTCLLHITSPPKAIDTSNPHIQAIMHLEKAFPDSYCPVEEFQKHFQIAFI